MGLIRKYRGHHGFHGLGRIGKLSGVEMFISLAAAMVNTIWAVYLYSFLQSDVVVGFFSAVLTVVGFFSYFLFIPLMERADKGKIYFYAGVLYFISYILFALNRNVYVLIGLAVITTILITIKVTCFGIIVRDSSEKNNLSKNEGIVYTFFNLAYVIGPLLAGYLTTYFNNDVIFFVAAGFLLVGLIFFKSAQIEDKGGKKKVDKNMIKNFFDFFRSKDRIIAYMLGAGVSIWWMLIYLFVPLWMLESGFQESHIGYFMFAVAIPLILFEYMFSRMTNKKGFKKMFLTGHIVLAIIAVICFFITNDFMILGLLVLASCGIAMTEPTTEAYFLDILRGKEQYRFYGPYNTALDVGSFIGKIAGSVTLIFLPFKYIFLVIGGFMFLLFLLSFRVRRIIEAKR